MKKVNIAKVVCAAGLTAACFCGVVGCTSSSSASGLTGGVAATVNGVEIAEDDITTSIQAMRESYSLSDDDSWGSYLSSLGMTPEEVRTNVIDSFVQRELIIQGAAEQGITVEDSELDTYVVAISSNYESPEKWEAALQQAGFEDEADYRENIKVTLLYERLQESFAVDDPTDEEVLETANLYASYYDGAKKSSHILFNSNDRETAQSVLDQINAGTLDFAAAAQQYSQDGSASDGGNVGWDCMSTFVDAYQTALDGLEVGQVSDLVESEYGIHIIMCTEQFAAPEEVTSLDQLPEDFVETFRTDVTAQKQNEAYQTWYEEYEAAADIVINDMPEGLPYAIDMSAYQTEESTDASAEDATSEAESADVSTEGEATDETAATDEGAAEDASGEGQDAASDAESAEAA